MIPIIAMRRRMMLAAATAGIDVAALAITYTGAYNDYGVVTMTDGQYRMLAFTGSGSLALAKAVKCEVCVVGGGANAPTDGNGGAGGYLKNQSITGYSGGAVVIGAAQGASSIGGVSVSAVSSKNGGSGGGAYGSVGAGTGDGVSKYPFGDTAYNLWASRPHCGGGGGGGYSSNYGNYTGGAGGTNGGNGGAAKTYSGVGDPSGGAGGAYGGGKGGSGSTSGSGSNATYYGSGGGGKGYGNGIADGSVGSGYQGIVYMRIPINQAA